MVFNFHQQRAEHDRLDTIELAGKSKLAGGVFKPASGLLGDSMMKQGINAL